MLSTNRSNQLHDIGVLLGSGTCGGDFVSGCINIENRYLILQNLDAHACLKIEHALERKSVPCSFKSRWCGAVMLPCKVCQKGYDTKSKCGGFQRLEFVYRDFRRQVWLEFLLRLVRETLPQCSGSRSWWWVLTTRIAKVDLLGQPPDSVTAVSLRMALA